MKKRKKRKLTSFVKMYRTPIEGLERHLDDPEFRLLYLYVRLADQDQKHGADNYGFADETQREIKKYYLSNWSIGKISNVRKRLIRKGLLNNDQGSTEVAGYSAYREKRVPEAERLLQELEQDVQRKEQTVQNSEQKQKQEPESKMEKPN